MAASIRQKLEPIQKIGQGICEGIATLKESPYLATAFAVAGLGLGFNGHWILGAFFSIGHLTLGDISMRNRQIRAGRFDAVYQKDFINRLAGRSIALIGGVVAGAGLKALSDYQFSKM